MALTRACTLYAAITNHGFGHATRMASVLAEVQQQAMAMRLDLRLIIATTAPRWLLEAYLPGEFIYRQQAFDVGVVQSDSLTMDRVATRSKLLAIQAQQADLIATEVAFIQQAQVDLLLADIPPLAAPIAQRAGIPGWMMSNFGWDFIYQEWGEPFAAICEWIRDCFSQCDRLFRLPFHEPMAAFPQITDVGLTGGTPRFPLADLRSQFALSAPREKTVLLTFGGLGLQQIPYDGLKHWPDWEFITFDRQAPKLPNLRTVENSQYRPVDFMPLVGRVISKPGYSTFAEACRQNLPITTLTREDFAEAELLIAGIQHYVPYQILQSDDFWSGTWEFLTAPWHPPHPSPEAIADLRGNESIAAAICDYLRQLRT